jgi:hypothetical protein
MTWHAMRPKSTLPLQRVRFSWHSLSDNTLFYIIFDRQTDGVVLINNKEEGTRNFRLDNGRVHPLNLVLRLENFRVAIHFPLYTWLRGSSRPIIITTIFKCGTLLAHFLTGFPIAS